MPKQEKYSFTAREWRLHAKHGFQNERSRQTTREGLDRDKMTDAVATLIHDLVLDSVDDVQTKALDAPSVAARIYGDDLVNFSESGQEEIHSVVANLLSPTGKVQKALQELDPLYWLVRASIKQAQLNARGVTVYPKVSVFGATDNPRLLTKYVTEISDDDLRRVQRNYVKKGLALATRIPEMLPVVLASMDLMVEDTARLRDEHAAVALAGKSADELAELEAQKEKVKVEQRHRLEQKALVAAAAKAPALPAPAQEAPEETPVAVSA